MIIFVDISKKLYNFRYVFSGKNYQDSLKGMFCTKTNITHILQDEDTIIEVANKPFLVIMFGYIIHLGLVVYFYFSAMKKRYHPKAQK